MKIHFRPKTEKAENDQIAHFGAENENEFRSASSLMAYLSDPDPLRFYDRSTQLVIARINKLCGRPPQYTPAALTF